MDCFGTAVSMSLQYGVPLEVYVNKFSHTRFEPWGNTKNPDIRIAKSIVDYIFRWLGLTFLPGYQEVNKLAMPPAGVVEAALTAAPPGIDGANAAPPKAANPSAASTVGAQPSGNGHAAAKQAAKRNGSSAAAASPAEAAVSPATRSEQFAKFQTDAPACDNCGSITVRSGNCYLCHNCGTSMGCS
jgi:ribonucleoside-diphosphate reductase alpha chain